MFHAKEDFNYILFTGGFSSQDSCLNRSIRILHRRVHTKQFCQARTQKNARLSQEKQNNNSWGLAVFCGLVSSFLGSGLVRIDFLGLPKQLSNRPQENNSAKPRPQTNARLSHKKTKLLRKPGIM